MEYVLIGAALGIIVGSLLILLWEPTKALLAFLVLWVLIYPVLHAYKLLERKLGPKNANTVVNIFLSVCIVYMVIDIIHLHTTP